MSTNEGPVNKELKDKDFFEDDNIEDDLSKLEAEIEKTGSTEDDIPSIDDAEPSDKKSEAVELDHADFSLEEEQGGPEKTEETEADTHEPGPEQPRAPGTPWYLNKNIVAASAIALVIAITFVIYVLMGQRVEPVKEKQKDAVESVCPVYYGSFRGKVGPRVVLPDPPLALSPFIVPVDQGKDDAYWFLSISVMSPNSKVYEEIKRKRAFLREGLYNLLREIVSGGEADITPREEIKNEIIKALNKKLQSGKINNIYFTSFLLV